MKSAIIISFIILFSLSGNGQLLATAKPKAEITSVKQNNNTIEFTILSTKPFIMGGNRYILHIGDKEFFLYKQLKTNGAGTVTFLIPVADFNSLTDGRNVFLTYGNPEMGEQSMEAMSKDESGACWLLGKFSHSLLTK